MLDAELNFPILALLFIAAVVFSAALTYLIRNLARRKGWVSLPKSHHIHRAGTPRLGGVAVYLTFAVFFGFSALMGWNAGWREDVVVLAAGSVLFVVGLVDDLRGVPALAKLALEVAAGIVLFASGARLLPVNLQLGWWNLDFLVSLGATIGWVVLITNALNLVDGLDGLAAGSALFSIITLCGLALVGRDSSVVVATLLLGGAVLGFLRYNFNPATIFLGDAGSLFLGFMLSGLALQGNRAAAPTLVAVAIPMVSFGLPIVETAVSVLRRFLRGKPLFVADKDHIHHRLLRMGFSHRQAVIALYGICAACALLSLFLLYPGRSLVGLVLLIVGTMFCIIVQRMGSPEFSEFTRIAQRTLEQKRVIANDIVIRNAAQTLSQCNSWAEVKGALDLLLPIGQFDSYQLTLADGTTVSGKASKAPATENADGNGRTRHSNGDGNSAEDIGGWAIHLDLHTSHGLSIGKFALGRVYRRRSVLVDLNLVINELEPALCQACERLQSNVCETLLLAHAATAIPGGEVPQGFA